MAYSDLTATQKQMVCEFTRTYRAAMAESVRGFRTMQLLVQSYVDSIAPLWATIADGDVIPDETGLAGADKLMTKADFAPMFTWSANLLAAVFSDNGGTNATNWPAKEAVEGYAVSLAGPTNL
jgi:hypothetical protein